MRGTTNYCAPIVIDEEISIHVPREGDDSPGGAAPARSRLFQSTSPVRGTTLNISFAGDRPEISIHVPREGDDKSGLIPAACKSHFNPRPP